MLQRRSVHELQLLSIVAVGFDIRSLTRDEKLIAAFAFPNVTILERLR
jgi:hypothetical protein